MLNLNGLVKLRNILNSLGWSDLWLNQDSLVRKNIGTYKTDASSILAVMGHFVTTVE